MKCCYHFAFAHFPIEFAMLQELFEMNGKCGYVLKPRFLLITTHAIDPFGCPKFSIVVEVGNALITSNWPNRSQSIREFCPHAEQKIEGKSLFIVFFSQARESSKNVKMYSQFKTCSIYSIIYQVWL